MCNASRLLPCDATKLSVVVFMATCFVYFNSRTGIIINQNYRNTRMRVPNTRVALETSISPSVCIFRNAKCTIP